MKLEQTPELRVDLDIIQRNMVIMNISMSLSSSHLIRRIYKIDVRNTHKHQVHINL